ncbi:MAG: hypothetical protein WA821_01255, partial [Anaerolineales bacterium]
MFKKFARSISALLLVSVIFILPVIFSSGSGDRQRQSNNQGEIDALLKAYAQALEKEKIHGLTQVAPESNNGETQVLTEASQAKMDRLWAETVAKIDVLEARPEAERLKTMEMLQKVSGNKPVYVSRDLSPYDAVSALEEYTAGKFIYQVDIASSQIVKVWLRDQKDYRVDPVYSSAQLADMARAYVAAVSPGLNLQQMTFNVFNKDREVYFFRWEDTTGGQLLHGMYPFVQVAYSRSGDFLNFENTLPFSRTVNNGLTEWFNVKDAFAIGVNEYYANGGSHWAWEVQRAPYSIQNNAGFCYTQGAWCTPKNFYYANSPSGNNTYVGSQHRGKWMPSSTMR